MDPVLLVVSKENCRLEDMSMEEPSVWLRTHTAYTGDKVSHREAGQPVGRFLSGFREARRKSPELFCPCHGSDALRDCVRVWGCPEATENEQICVFLSQYIHSVFANAVLQVDMFAGEATDWVRLNNFCLQQAKHTVPPKQTAKLQVCDI